MEIWFENPPVRIRRKRRGGVVNPNTGGLLMIANKKRTHRRRRRIANPINRRRRSHKGRFVRVRHMSANPRRRNRRRSRGGFGAGMPSFLSAGMLRDVGFGALGAVAPTIVTDRILPMVGLTLTGWTRRLVQLAVPTAVLWLGGTRFVLGKEGLHSFALGAYIVTALGVVNDFTGGIATISGAPALGNGQLGAFERMPSLGMYEDAAATAYA
jgi:hypothetical protein